MKFFKNLYRTSTAVFLFLIFLWCFQSVFSFSKNIFLIEAKKYSWRYWYLLELITILTVFKIYQNYKTELSVYLIKVLCTIIGLPFFTQTLFSIRFIKNFLFEKDLCYDPFENMRVFWLLLFFKLVLLYISYHMLKRIIDKNKLPVGLFFIVYFLTAIGISIIGL